MVSRLVQYLAEFGGEGLGLAGVAELATHETAVVAGEDRGLLVEPFGQCDRGPTGVDIRRLFPDLLALGAPRPDPWTSYTAPPEASWTV